MPLRIRNYIKFFVAAFLLVSFCLVEADAQTKKKRTTRRTTAKAPAPKPVITNPPIAPPTETATPANDVKIISTADASAEPAENQEATTSASAAKKAPTEGNSNNTEMQKTINNLSDQVERLNDKLSQMNEDDRYHLDMERLTRAEQRAEQLRSQLIDTESKMADIESRLEGVEYALRPENIDRATQGYGSTRPEEARDARRKQLETERTRLKSQLALLQTSKSRLAVACTAADNEVDLLRAKLQQKRDQMDTQPPAERSRRKPKPDEN
jgi:chromosome segregation ATPase